MKKKCKDCGKLKDKMMFYGVQGECKKCSQKRIKENYYKNREHYIQYEKDRFKNPERRKKLIEYQKIRRHKNKGKDRCRQKLNRYLQSGKIIKENCKICGSENSQAHHIDYRKPLLVMWLCRKHHLELENKKTYEIQN